MGISLIIIGYISIPLTVQTILIMSYKPHLLSKLILILFLLLFLQTKQQQFHCDRGSIDELCIVSEAKIFTSNVRVEGKGSLRIESEVECTTQFCLLDLKFDKDIEIVRGGHLKAPQIHLRGSSITVFGRIFSDKLGYGPNDGPGAGKCVDGCCGGAGFGGDGYCTNEGCSGLANGDIANPWASYGSGSGGENGIGGRCLKGASMSIFVKSLLPF